MEMKCFAVTAKCGHVGRQFYYKGVFYVKAFTGCEAATITRNLPRVKHDHIDAILGIEEITTREYKIGQLLFASNVYFQCMNRRQQSYYWEEIKEHIHPETDLALKNRQKDRYQKDKPELRIRKPYKRARFQLQDSDLEGYAS